MTRDPINVHGRLICGYCKCAPLKPPAIFTVDCGVKVIRLQCHACKRLWPPVRIVWDDPGGPYEFDPPPIDLPTPPGPVLLHEHQNSLGIWALNSIPPRVLIHRPMLLDMLRRWSHCTIDDKGHVVRLDRYSETGFHPDQDTIA